MGRSSNAKTENKMKRKGPNAKSKKKGHNKNDFGDSWISMLAKQSSTEISGVTSLGSGSTVVSKAERIERRSAKKRRREERRGSVLDQKKTGHDRAEENVLPISRRRSGAYNSASVDDKIRKLSQKVENALKDSNCEGAESEVYNDSDSLAKGKATSGQRKITEDALQPRKRDYGGLGSARPSLYLDLHDPSFVPKVSPEFLI